METAKQVNEGLTEGLIRYHPRPHPAQAIRTKRDRNMRLMRHLIAHLAAIDISLCAFDAWFYHAIFRDNGVL